MSPDFIYLIWEATVCKTRHPPGSGFIEKHRQPGIEIVNNNIYYSRHKY